MQMVYEKRRTKVVINEREYTIVGNKSSAHIKLVADTVNNQIEELKQLSSTLSKEEQAILIAVNAISDQIELHEKVIELEKKVEEFEKE